jgi:hypothetical protein
LLLTDINLEEWYKIIGVDLTGPFICSRADKASYVIGASYFVDGGMTLYPSFGTTPEHDSYNCC